MSVVIETTLGDITVDLFLQQRPVTCLNFLKLCKMKYYNFNLFHSIRGGFIAQTGDPTGEGTNGESIFGVLEGREKRFFSGEKLPKIRHTNTGTLSMVCTDDMMVGSQFFFTLAPDLDSLDSVHCVIGEVTEGHDVLRKLNDVICDEKHRPYRDVRITHTVILEDPFNDPPGFHAPSRSPSPSAERLKGGRIAPDEDIDEAQGKSAAEIQEIIEEKEAKARATILEIVGDLPDADIAPPENVLFVCKLNPVTTDEDLEIIFSRFGTIVGCEVIRDKKTGDSLQYAFVEFSDKKSCEEAYFKMDNVLIDDRRIHVDFSQSVSKMRYLGKGRGVQYFNDDNDSNFEGKSNKDINRNNNGDYKNGETDKRQENKDSDKNGDRNSKRKRSRSRERDRKNSRREGSRSKRERSKSRRERGKSRRNRSRSRSKQTSKSSRHRRDRSSSKSRNEKSHDRKRDRKSSPKKSRSDRKSSRDRRLRSPSSYSRHSRSRTERSRDSRRDRRGSERKSKRDKSFEKKRHKSISKSRSNSRTRTRKSNDKKEITETISKPERPQELSTDDLTGSVSEKIIISSRSRSKSQNKDNLSEQKDILNNFQAESIIKLQEIPVEKKIVSNVRKNDLKANYSTYWRKSAQETTYPQEQISNIALNTSTTTIKSLIDKSRDKMEKQKISRWERPQESNSQNDQTNNEIEIEETTTRKILEDTTSHIDTTRDDKHEISNLVKPQEPNSQVEQTRNEGKSETLKWRRLQDATTQEHSDRKSRTHDDQTRDEKHAISNLVTPQEPNSQVEQTNNEGKSETLKWRKLQDATTQEHSDRKSRTHDDQTRDEKHEISNLVKPQEPNSQVKQTNNEGKSETLKWRRIQDATTQEHSDRKSRSKSPIEKERELIKGREVLDNVSRLEIKQQEIMQEKRKSATRSKSKSPKSRLEQQPKSQSTREKTTSESKTDRTRRNSSNSNETRNNFSKSKKENIEDDRKSLNKTKSAKLDESPRNDSAISRSRSKSNDNTCKKREKSLEPTPEIESKKLSKKDDSSKRNEKKKSHKEKKLKHHKETAKVTQKSEKKHKKNKELLPVTKKKHKTAKTDKKSKKVAKKRKRKHSTSSSSESSDSSSSGESSSSSEDERKKRSLKRRKKKLSTSSSSDSSTSSSSSSSSSTSSSSSHSEPSKKKRKKVISSKASKKGKKKQ